MTLPRAIAEPPRRSDAYVELRGLSVIAAALVLAFLVGFAVRAGTEDAEAHSCSATDRRFIEAAKTDMTALGAWSDSYRDGSVAADEVAEHARDAAKRVKYVKPHDPSLRLSQRLMEGMFREYGQAVALAAKERSRAGEHMHRAYGLADFARQVLVRAQPELAKRGCDVTALL